MHAPPSGTDAIEHEVWVDARPETVFAFFTDPQKLVRWIGVAATLDPRPGGMCRIAMAGPAVMHGEFVEVVPSSRVVVTWGWEEKLFNVPPASTLVEVALAAERGGTRVRLTHSRLPDAARDFHRAGWDYFIPRLVMVATGKDPGPDLSARLVSARLGAR